MDIITDVVIDSWMAIMNGYYYYYTDTEKGTKETDLKAYIQYVLYTFKSLGHI